MGEELGAGSEPYRLARLAWLDNGRLVGYYRLWFEAAARGLEASYYGGDQCKAHATDERGEGFGARRLARCGFCHLGVDSEKAKNPYYKGSLQKTEKIVR